MNSFDKKEYGKAFAAGFMSAISEKRAGWLSDLGGGVTTLAKSLAGVPKDVFLYGSMLGVPTGMIAHEMYDNLTRESPEEELNRKLESMYAAKRKELDDARWMSRVRKMREELRVNRKKMSVDEYTEKYNALVDALKERKA